MPYGVSVEFFWFEPHCFQVRQIHFIPAHIHTAKIRIVDTYIFCAVEGLTQLYLCNVEQRTPFPIVWKLKNKLFINRFRMRILTDIIRVILTTEDDGFLLVSLDFALLDEFLFLCTDALQQDGSRLVVWVLWYKLAMNGEIEDFGFGGCYYGK